MTGANILVDTGEMKFLVDCGIEQRENLCSEINHGTFSYDPRDVKALIVTHAHLDHIGRIPKLVRDGFHGTIHSTMPTKELAALMFEDALSIMSAPEQAADCTPLYDRDDADRALSLWHTHAYHEPFAMGDVSVVLLDAGHILGSAVAVCERNGKQLAFSGDLGNTPEPILNETEYPVGADYLLIESVYGDRVHEGREMRRERLKEVIEAVRQERGVLLIPSFSIERTQVLLYEINSMVESGEIEPLPVFLDSPLAIKVTEVFARHREMMNPAVRERIAKGDDPFQFEGLKFTLKRAQSREIEREENPKIIIAGAGMSHGGRIRTHEKQYLRDTHATILFVGYQAPGSLGRRILDGAHAVEIEGEWVRVQANVESIFGYSGHKDRDGLMEFVEKTGPQVKKVFVILGEPKSSLFLAQRLHDFLGMSAMVPERGEVVSIDW